MGSFLASIVLDSVFGKVLGKVLSFGLPIIAIICYVVFRTNRANTLKDVKQTVKTLREVKRIKTNVHTFIENKPDALGELLSGRGYQRLRNAR